MVYALVQAVIILVVMKSLLVRADKDYIPPKITFPNNNQQDLYFMRGHKAKINCLSNGNPKPTFKWLQNGIEINQTQNMGYHKSSGILEIEIFVSIYESTYRCIATNQYQNVSVSTISPKIHMWQFRLEKFFSYAGEIHDVTEYHYLKLACGDWKTSRAPKLHYAWYNADNSRLIDMAGDRLYIDWEGSLHFIYVLSSDKLISGYECGISTSLANANSFIQLGTTHIVHVNKARSTPRPGLRIQFLYSNSVVMARTNTTAMLECVFSAYNSVHIPMQYWANALKIPYQNSSKMTISKDGRQLFIHNVQEEDEMRYYCKAQTPVSVTTSSVFMNVTSGPVFINGPLKDKIGFVNSKVDFNCDSRSAKGEKPPKTPIWFINSREVDGNYDRTKFEFTNYNKILTVKKLRKPQDVMCVQCQVENHVDVVLATACLDVVLPMTIKREPNRTQQINHGDKIDLTVIATTDEPLKLNYKWTMPDRTFDEKTIPYFMFWNPSNQTAIIYTEKINTTQYQKTVGGKYTITVFTEHQTFSVNVKVVLLDKQEQIDENGGQDGKDKKKEPTWIEDIPDWMLALVAALALVLFVILFITCLTRKKDKLQGEEEDDESFTPRRSIATTLGTTLTDTDTEV